MDSKKLGNSQTYEDTIFDDRVIIAVECSPESVDSVLEAVRENAPWVEVYVNVELPPGMVKPYTIDAEYLESWISLVEELEVN